jgi:hypothetical protein
MLGRPRPIFDVRATTYSTGTDCRNILTDEMHRRRFPNQNCHRVFVLRSQHSHIDRCCPDSLQLSRRLLHFHF